MNKIKLASDLVKLAKELTASKWGKAIDSFENDYKKLVISHKNKMAKNMLNDVAKLFEDMKKSLPGYDFIDGQDAKKAAYALVKDTLLLPRDGEHFDQWGFDNFFTQGYANLEQRKQIDLKDASKKLEDVLTKVVKQKGFDKYKIDVNTASMYKNGVEAIVEVEEKEDEDLDIFDLIDAVERIIGKEMDRWAQQQGVAEPSVHSDLNTRKQQLIINLIF